MIPLKDTSIVEITIRKDPSVPWVSFDNYLVFNEEEQAITKAWADFVEALPGFVSLTNQREPETSNVNYKEILFDSQEHAIAAAKRLFGDNADPIVKARDELLRSKSDKPNAFDRQIFCCKEPFSKTIALGKVLPGIG